MKITIGPNINLSGYSNLGFIKTLDAHCDNSEATEIIAPDILSYIEADRVQEFIVHLVQKLRHGGKLILGGRDIMCVAQKILSLPAQTTIMDLNAMIYGKSNERPTCCMLHVNLVSDILQSLGMEIIRKSLEGDVYTVEARRP